MPDVLVLYASQTGQSKAIAEELSLRLQKASVEHRLYCVSAYERRFHLTDCRAVLVVASTTGQGDPPDVAQTLYRRLLKNTNSDKFLSHLRFAILGLGDSNYQTFCAFPKALVSAFESVGARPFHASTFADDVSGLDTTVEPWLTDIVPKLIEFLKTNAIANDGNLPAKRMPRTKEPSFIDRFDDCSDLDQFFDVLKGDVVTDEEIASLKLPSVLEEKDWPFNVEFDTSPGESDEDFFTRYTLDMRWPMAECRSAAACDPVPLKVTQRRRMTSKDAQKAVDEVWLDVSALRKANLDEACFRPGATLHLLCGNDAAEVRKLCELIAPNCADKRMRLEWVKAKESDVSGRLKSQYGHLPVGDDRLLLSNLFRCCIDIRSPPRKPLLLFLSNTASAGLPSCAKHVALGFKILSSFQASKLYTKLIRECQISLLDTLQHLFDSIPLVEVSDSITKLVATSALVYSSEIRPRPYSISNYVTPTSSLVRIVVTEVSFTNGFGRRIEQDRYGVASGALKRIGIRSQCAGEDEDNEHHLPTTEAFIYPKNTAYFSLPNVVDTAKQLPPLILIGAGSGISPYMGFLEQLEHERRAGTRRCPVVWLVYGCRHPEKDFLFREELTRFKQSGILQKLTVCFSRYPPKDSDNNAGDVTNGAKDDCLPVGWRTGYVQDALEAESDELVTLWLERSGVVYVCGDVQGLMRDVRELLKTVLCPDDARFGGTRQLKKLTERGQYKEDVWL